MVAIPVACAEGDVLVVVHMAPGNMHHAQGQGVVAQQPGTGTSLFALCFDQSMPSILQPEASQIKALSLSLGMI